MDTSDRYYIVEEDQSVAGPDGVPLQYKAGDRMHMTEALRLGLVENRYRTNQAPLVSRDASDEEREAEIARLEVAEKPHQTLDAGSEGKALEGQVEGSNEAGSVTQEKARRYLVDTRENRAADADTAKRGKG